SPPPADTSRRSKRPRRWTLRGCGGTGSPSCASSPARSRRSWPGRRWTASPSACARSPSHSARRSCSSSRTRWPSTCRRSTVIPFAVELPETAADPRGAEPPALLFFGGYRHPPNADAALRLERSIFPAVRASHPDVQLELVGGGATPEMLAAAGEGILLRGH